MAKVLNLSEGCHTHYHDTVTWKKDKFEKLQIMTLKRRLTDILQLMNFIVIWNLGIKRGTSKTSSK